MFKATVAALGIAALAALPASDAKAADVFCDSGGACVLEVPAIEIPIQLVPIVQTVEVPSVLLLPSSVVRQRIVIRQPRRVSRQVIRQGLFGRTRIVNVQRF